MIMGGITAFVFNPQDYELYAGFWGCVYLLIYIIFPLLYRPKIKQKGGHNRPFAKITKLSNIENLLINQNNLLEIQINNTEILINEQKKDI